MPTRCFWCNEKNPRYIAYHDTEWGKLSLDDGYLFEMLLLESFQAGLSWETVLNKRDAFRSAFADFDVEQVAAFDATRQEAIAKDPAIIRNRLKIKAAVTNAAVFLNIQKEYGSFRQYLSTFTELKPSYEIGKTTSPLSDALSHDLYRRGMRFVGSVILYSYLQAIGLVVSHEKSCFLYQDIGKELP